jgi:uncharacterized protein involved in exopolysaccharide biosynthesis
VTRYIETLFRHKLLLCAPLVLTLLVSVWYVSSQSKTYTTTTTAWFDNQLPNPSYLDGGTANQAPPAQTAMNELTQLLTTKDFLVGAGKHSPDPTNPTAQGPLEAELSAQNSKTPLDDRIVNRLAGNITTAALGSQVLSISLTDSDPTLAPKQLQAVVEEFFDYVRNLRSTREKSQVDYIQPRLNDATDVLQKAQGDQLAYLQAHPSAGQIGVVDPQFASLTSAVAAAQAKYSDLENQFTTATQALSTEETSSSAHIIDPPSPAVAAARKSKAVFAVGAGLFFGLLIGLLGLVALTAADTAARRREDVESSRGGLQVVATISEFDRSESREAAK